MPDHGGLPVKRRYATLSVRSMTFAEKFCAQHNLAPEKFESDVLRRSLHNRARLLWPLLVLVLWPLLGLGL